MSTRYAYVWRREWRGTLKSLSKDEKIVLLALRTGPFSTALPGLVEADVLMLVSVTELTVGEVEGALAGLVRKKRIAVDADRCMVRIFGLPDPEEPPAPVRSYKTLAGWFSLWHELPESPLKYEQIAPLLAACDLDTPGKDGQPSMREEWDRTFGRVSPPPAGTAIDTPSDTPIDTPSDRASATPSDASVQRTAYSVSEQRTAEEEIADAAVAAPPRLALVSPKAKAKFYATRDELLVAIAETSNGSFVACHPDKGGTFKLDRLRKNPACLEVAAKVGAMLAAGGTWQTAKGQRFTGRDVGANLDAWIALAAAAEPQEIKPRPIPLEDAVAKLAKDDVTRARCGLPHLDGMPTDEERAIIREYVQAQRGSEARA